MNVSIYLLFAISIFTTVSAHLLFKKGVIKLGEMSFSLSGVYQTILQVAQNFWILLGVFSFGISFLTWLYILSRMQLNIAYPVIFSIQVTLVTVFSWLLFKEYLSHWQILGIVFVMLGIFLLTTRG